MWIHQNGVDYPAAITWTQFLAPEGILADQWPLPPVPTSVYRQAATDPDQQALILAAIEAPLTALKQQNGYVTEDIVWLSPDNPQFEALLAMFRREHHHTDDEVRLILSGSGVFGIVPPAAPAFEVHVSPGDLLVVPAYTRHWFTLGPEQHVVAVRVFRDPSGWVAHYEPTLQNAYPLPIPVKREP